MLFCVSPSTGLSIVFLLESTFLGAALTGTVISGRFMLAGTEELHNAGLTLSREWYFALFFSLLPLSIMQIVVLLSLVKASQLHRAGWLLPYIVWRMFLSLSLVVAMIVTGITTWPTRADREMMTWVFTPMVVSIAVGIWTLAAILQIRAKWMDHESYEHLEKASNHATPMGRGYRIKPGAFPHQQGIYAGFGNTAAANINYHRLFENGKPSKDVTPQGTTRSSATTATASSGNSYPGGMVPGGGFDLPLRPQTGSLDRQNNYFPYQNNLYNTWPYYFWYY